MKITIDGLVFFFLFLFLKFSTQTIADGENLKPKATMYRIKFFNHAFDYAIKRKVY